MLGVIKHSRAPIRFVTFLGFLFSFFSILTAIVYFVYKLLFWNSFELGIAPVNNWYFWLCLNTNFTTRNNWGICWNFTYTPEKYAFGN